MINKENKKEFESVLFNMCLGDKIILFNYIAILGILSGVISSLGNIQNIKAVLMELFIIIILALVNNVLLTIKNYKR